MKRGDVWLAEAGGKRRPVVVLTRSEVIEIRRLVTVAEVTTSVRGIPVEVPLDSETTGLSQPSVINCDGLHTVPQSTLTTKTGEVSDAVLNNVCVALNYALGCPLR